MNSKRTYVAGAIRLFCWNEGVNLSMDLFCGIYLLLAECLRLNAMLASVSGNHCGRAWRHRSRRQLQRCPYLVTSNPGAVRRYNLKLNIPNCGVINHLGDHFIRRRTTDSATKSKQFQATRQICLLLLQLELSRSVDFLDDVCAHRLLQEALVPISQTS